MGDKARIQRAPTHIDAQKCINVLLVVARGENDAIDCRLTSRPLLQKLAQDSSGSVSVDIARPGTRELFLKCLSEKDYDIVHLDDPEDDYTVQVSADDIGKALFINRVKLVIMNACQSASTTRSSTADFAHQLASHGVPYVLGMAFKVTHTAVEIFTSALHDCLLWDTRNILLAVYEARAKLRANKERSSDLFGLPISLQDDILPILYSSDRQLHKHSVSLLETSCEPPAAVSTPFDQPFGRELDMLQVENSLLRNRVCIVHGPYGIGKRCMINNLSKWLHESRLVQHVFHMDCSSGISSLDSALAAIRRQANSVIATELIDKPEDEDPILLAMFSEATLLVFNNAENGTSWLSELCLKLAVLERPEDDVPLFILVSTRTSLLSVRRKLSRTKPGGHFAYELKDLDAGSASKLAENLLQGKPRKEESYSALWYRQSILMLLQHNPLAIEAVIPVAASRESHEIYWYLKTGRLDLNWETPHVKQLFLQWKNLVEDHRGLLQALIPFTTSVPEDYLAKVSVIYRVDPSARQALVEAGCTNTEGLRASIGPLRLHPLFAQFTRYQPWSEEDITSSWRRASAYYHDRSIDWITTGLYNPTTQRSKPKDEWENLTAVLSHLISELQKDTETSALFDLSCVVCSFHVFHKDIPKHAIDMFADLTLKALNAMVPELVPTSNEGLRFIVDQGLNSRARKLSNFQILRITLLAQFLVHYYYDISLKTAIWADVSSDLDLSSTFRTFADVWGTTHGYRRLGFVLDLTETWRNHQNRARYSINSSEVFSPLKSLDTLVDAFDALNSVSTNNDQDFPPLDQSLREAIQRYDTRSQLDIYDKLAEVYFNSGDWETVLFILDKIDQCSHDICRFRGTNIDEVSTLEQKRWMTTMRVQCLKYLGRISESKARIEELKKIVSRREDLWTAQDRQNEQYQNLTALVERRMGRLSSSTRYNVGDYVFRPRTFHEAEVPRMQYPKGSSDLGTDLQAKQPGIVVQEAGDADSRLANATTVGDSGETSSRRDVEEDDSDNLYFINKPWMKKVDKFLDVLGGTRVEEHYDFQIPPGRIGGLFLYQSRVLMADAFLKALGVLQPD
ncbi:CHAT domain-containing protein [Fusarium denticulatum]|uniref:CHAT domain-containing protein n=1 Tax=Fusarium denticulatum TaxID=48507 RepID=A0A8H5UFD1_9HYPO|nr:CHAT domain-containing protein [Fusarium denticulatum]